MVSGDPVCIDIETKKEEIVYLNLFDDYFERVLA